MRFSVVSQTKSKVHIFFVIPESQQNIKIKEVDQCACKDFLEASAITFKQYDNFDITKDIFQKSLSPSSARLSTCTGQRISVCSKFKARVRYGQQVRVCRLMIVVEGDGPDLVQRDWLRHSRLD